jgi:hypothetical protein
MKEEKINIEDVKQEIEELVSEFKKRSDDFKKRSDEILNAENDSEFTLLQIGEKLSAISISMTEKEFANYKVDTAKKLNFEKSSLDKVIKISRNRGIRENKEKLPAGWATLYLLSQIEPKHFDEFIRESGVNKSTTRTDIRDMVDTFKEKRPDLYPPKKQAKKREKLTVGQSTDASAEPKSSEDLKVALKEFLAIHGWVIVKSKEKKEQE